MLTTVTFKKAVQKEITTDGALFILWGWLMFYATFTGYLQREYLLQHIVERSLNITGYLLGLITIIATIIYFIANKKSAITESGSVWPIWVTMFGSMIFINLILNNVLHTLNLELQHPIFMIVIAFAIIATGNALKSQIFIYGGILFGILALIASYFPLAEQLLLEATGWLLAIVLPGHFMYLKSKRAS